MTVRAYVRCSHGHYFRTPQCPFDGLYSPASGELGRAVGELAGRSREPTLESLREAGVSESTLARVMVVDFLDPADAWEGMCPEGYVIAGEWRPLANLGPYWPAFH